MTDFPIEAVAAGAGAIVLLVLTVLLTRRRKPAAAPPAIEPVTWAAPAPVPPPMGRPAPSSAPTPPQTIIQPGAAEGATQVAGRTVQPAWQLTGLSGAAAGQLVPLLQRLTIGRSLDSDLHPDDSKMSRHHALLEQAAAGWQVTDLGSTNGTFVNDQRIGHAMLLKEGDVLAVGDCRWQVQALAKTAATQFPAEPSVPPVFRPAPAPAAPAAAPPAVCSQCRAALPPGSAFCIKCGSPVRAPTRPAASTCARCGSPVTEDSSFCLVCGARLERK